MIQSSIGKRLHIPFSLRFEPETWYKTVLQNTSFYNLHLETHAHFMQQQNKPTEACSMFSIRIFRYSSVDSLQQNMLVLVTPSDSSIWIIYI